MPRLEHLRKSLLSMSPDELRAKINAIREDRVIRKDTKAPKTKAQKAEKKGKVRNQLEDLLAGMSDIDREAFLKELEG